MLPDELRKQTQWLVSGEDKAPRSAHTGRLADVRDASNYASYDVAFDYASQNGLDIGFALTPDDPYTVVDLDEPENPEQKERAQKIIEHFDTYAEVSRSGRGVHIWCRGRVPRGVRRDKVELYSDSRYMVCTGNALNGSDINDCQTMLNYLYEEVARDLTQAIELEDKDEILSDADVVEMASRAANGDKFDQLCRGEWEGEYPSQSEADFALMNMFTYYSSSNEQCRRLFRYSALGKRQKAQRDKYLNYMIGKIRAEEAPPIDFTELVVPAKDVVPVLKVDDPLPRPIGNTPSHMVYPPGLVGELARYITDTAPRPVREVGVAAALAMCAGIIGRQYNVSGTGLNMYCILLAKTGVGKEGGPAGISRLVSKARERVPSVELFVGPGTFASGQAIIRTLDEKPSVFCTLGEFGLTLQMLSDPKAGSHLVVMRRVLLDLYSKSGQTSVLLSTAYSDKEKNTKMIQAPALTIFGESTPESFYAGLSQSQIADGLIPRFLIIEYHGGRPDRNPLAFADPDEPLVDRFVSVVTTSLQMLANNTFMDVQVSPEAQVIFNKLDRECDAHINAGQDDAERQLWNRAHLKSLKIGALLAAMDRPHDPTITEEEARWAVNVVMTDLLAIHARFERGEIGEGNSKQLADLERIVRDYVNQGHAQCIKYGVSEKAHTEQVIPYVYLRRRTANLSAYKNDRMGAKNALRSNIDELVQSGQLEQIPPSKMHERYGTKSYGYKVLVVS